MCGMPFDFPCAAFAASIPAVSLLSYLTVLQYAFLKTEQRSCLACDNGSEAWYFKVGKGGIEVTNEDKIVASTGPQVKKCVAAFVRNVVAIGSAFPALPRSRSLTCRLYYNPESPPPIDFQPSALFQVSCSSSHMLLLREMLPYSALCRSCCTCLHLLQNDLTQAAEDRLSWGSKPLCFPVGTDYHTPYHSGPCRCLRLLLFC